MGYSAVQLLSEWVLTHSKPQQHNRLMALFFALSGAALAILGLGSTPAPVIACMLVLPLFLDIPSYLLGEVQNRIVDAAGRQSSRAELLSIFNMGVSVTEILYLFSSSLLASAGAAACFVLLGAFMFAAGAVICLLDARRESRQA